MSIRPLIIEPPDALPKDRGNPGNLLAQPDDSSEEVALVSGLLADETKEKSEHSGVEDRSDRVPLLFRSLALI